MNFKAGITPPGIEGLNQVYWLLFKDNQLLVSKAETPQFIFADYHSIARQSRGCRFLGYFGEHPCYAAIWEGASLRSDFLAYPLRALFGKMDMECYEVAGRAQHLLYWDQTHRYCGKCGAATIDSREETAKVCPACGFIAYPRIAPAIIVAVVKDDQILLAQANRFPSHFYSVIAGFVEPGETLEECVQREIREEVGVRVRRIRYFGSQPWPFPDSLMIAFTSEYAGGELNIDPGEIAAAGWFRADELPEIPGAYSIARRLIDWFVAGCP